MSGALRIVTGAEIARLLPMAECIDLMAKTMVAVSTGGAVLPLRSIMAMPGDIGRLGMMPGYLASADAYGVKLVSLIPGNARTGHSSHVGVLLLFETTHGYPIGFLDAAELTAIRTAAASGLATRLLARANASRLAILGTGEQARRHIEAMRLVRPVADIRIWGRNRAKAEALAAAHGARACGDVTEAVDGADIICTVTHADEPILTGAMIGRGTHVNAVGSSIPTTAEIDGALVAQARFYADFREATIAQGGEYRRAIDDGLIAPGHILGEIGEVAAGTALGRIDAADITLYKSLGIAAQDIAAGRYVLDRAAAQDVGQTVQFG